MSAKLDNINKIILLSLQEDAQLPLAAIADMAGISTSTCQKRIKQLESQGMVTSYSATINLSKICTSVTFVIEVTLQEHNANAFLHFEEIITKEETLVECYQIAGSFDYYARFVCSDVENYKAITDRLLAQAPIKSIQSHCMLKKIKRFSGYPLEYLLEKSQA